MKRFVVAYMSLFDNNLKMEIVEGNDPIKILQDHLFREWDIKDEDKIDIEMPNTLEDLQNYCFNGEYVINIIEV